MGGPRRSAKATRALKTGAEWPAIGSRQRLTDNDHQSWSSYNYMGSCWRAQCRPLYSRSAFEANWRSEKAWWVDASGADQKNLLFYLFIFIYFNWRWIPLQYCDGFCHTFTWISHGWTCVPILTPSPLPPHPIPQGDPSAPAPSTLHRTGLAICFTYGNIHVSMLFSQIIPPSPSPTESKRLFYTSVSLLLSHM